MKHSMPPFLTKTVIVSLAWMAFLTTGYAQQERAQQILEAAGFSGGLIVHVGCGDGKLTAALCGNDRTMVQGLDRNPANVRQAREYVKSRGIYGTITIDQLRSNRMPYVDNLVNLVVADSLGRVPMAEVMRVLCPNGVAYIGGKKTVKPWPDNIDEWTHYLHDPSNNAVAHDDVVGPPRHLQWVGSPRWARHHDHMHSLSAQVSAKGRLFYILDEGPRSSILLPSKWSLFARDAFNGTVLWKRDIEKWHTRLWPLKSGPAQLPRRLVAVDDTVYVTLSNDAPVSALDAVTGKTLRTYGGTEATEEILLADGVLFLVVNRKAGEKPTFAPDESSVRSVRSSQNSWMWTPTPRTITAIEANTGNVLWQQSQPVAPLTLTVAGQRLFSHDGDKIVCLDRNNGKQLWTSKPLPRWETMRSYYAPTLVVYDGVVLFAGGEKMVPHYHAVSSMTALSANTGEVLWTSDHAPSGYQSPEDILVSNGIVWSGATSQGSYDGMFTGRDLRTGEIKSQFPPDVDTHWFHHRCHRGKATDKYLLMSRTGIEFIDPSTKHWTCHHWVRGACLYGVMPGNGMIYAGPHPCACYIEAKLFGMNALAAESPTRQVPRDVPDAGRLERGAAYAHPLAPQASLPETDWPTYRHDDARSGVTRSNVPTKLEQVWTTGLGGNLTSVVIAGDKLFVASIEDHTVHALDAGSGAKLWNHSAGGRIDSPPTAWRGRVYFGSHDGWVTCLRAADGELCWKFRAAPMDRKHLAFEQVESVWPVFGSVLIRDGVLYCVAGRSMFLDGGIRWLKLNPESGRKIAEVVLDDKDPETGENLQKYVTGLNMTVALPDILSSDDKYIYMRSMAFDPDGARQEIAYRAVNKQKAKGDDIHLFASGGFLDGSWWHRSYWTYGRSVASGAGGYYLAGKVAPSARILSVTDNAVYGYGRKPQYYRWTTPIEYQLFRTSKELPDPKPAIRRKGRGSYVGVEVSKSLDAAGKPLALEAWVQTRSGNGVVVARGGSAHGFSLVLQDAIPSFVVRSNKVLSTVSAEEKIGNGWVHLAGALRPDKRIELYVNGKLAVSGPCTGLLAGNPAQAMEIGADEGGGVGDYGSPFGLKGNIDDVRLYFGNVSAAEIAAHAANPTDVAAQKAKLVAHYTFDDGKAADMSGNGNDGTIEGVKPVKGKAGGALRFRGVKKRARAISPHSVEYDWVTDIPLHVRAMVIAGDTMFIAGPPDMLDEEAAARSLADPETQAKLTAQAEAFSGSKGSVLWAVATADGTKIAEYKLTSMPRWDGMAAANARLYFATTDGKVVCMD